MVTDRYSRLIGRLSHRGPNGAGSLFGDDHVPWRTTGHLRSPEVAVLVPRQTTERPCPVRQQPIDDLSGHAHEVTHRGVF